MKYLEVIFEALYLIIVIYLGIKMALSKNNNTKLFGIMAIVLGVGDSFHLVPRIYGTITNTMDTIPEALGFGKLVTSITMTVFYVLLYIYYKKRFKVEKRWQDVSIYILAIVRVVLCVFPQNDWFSANPPLLWGIYRNIPFTILGIIIIILFFKAAKNDKYFKWLWLGVLLSFAFYLPVVLFAGEVPIVGMLMLPKTIAYLWIIYMGFKEYKESSKIKF